MNHWRHIILVLFCVNESVTIIIPDAASIFTKLNPETATQINEDLEITESVDAYFCKKKFKLRSNRFS